MLSRVLLMCSSAVRCVHVNQVQFDSRIVKFFMLHHHMFHVQNVERLHVTAEPETGSCSSETYDVEQTSFIDVESARFATMLSTQKKKTASRLVNHDKLKTFISSYSACARVFEENRSRAATHGKKLRRRNTQTYKTNRALKQENLLIGLCLRGARQ